MIERFPRRRLLTGGAALAAGMLVAPQEARALVTRAHFFSGAGTTTEGHDQIIVARLGSRLFVDLAIFHNGQAEATSAWSGSAHAGAKKTVVKVSRNFGTEGSANGTVTVRRFQDGFIASVKISGHTVTDFPIDPLSTSRFADDQLIGTWIGPLIVGGQPMGLVTVQLSDTDWSFSVQVTAQNQTLLSASGVWSSVLQGTLNGGGFCAIAIVTQSLTINVPQLDGSFVVGDPSEIGFTINQDGTLTLGLAKIQGQPVSVTLTAR